MQAVSLFPFLPCLSGGAMIAHEPDMWPRSRGQTLESRPHCD
jgi:hypothetical protein